MSSGRSSEAAGGDIPGCTFHSGMCWNVVPSPGISFLFLGFWFAFIFDFVFVFHLFVPAFAVENVTLKHSFCCLINAIRSQLKGSEVKSVLHVRFPGTPTRLLSLNRPSFLISIRDPAFFSVFCQNDIPRSSFGKCNLRHWPFCFGFASLRSISLISSSSGQILLMGNVKKRTPSKS
jgi:hypothetical protein